MFSEHSTRMIKNSRPPAYQASGVSFFCSLFHKVPVHRFSNTLMYSNAEDLQRSSYIEDNLIRRWGVKVWGGPGSARVCVWGMGCLPPRFRPHFRACRLLPRMMPRLPLRHCSCRRACRRACRCRACRCACVHGRVCCCTATDPPPSLLSLSFFPFLSLSLSLSLSVSLSSSLAPSLPLLVAHALAHSLPPSYLKIL